MLSPIDLTHFLFIVLILVLYCICTWARGAGWVELVLRKLHLELFDIGWLGAASVLFALYQKHNEVSCIGCDRY